MIPTHINEKHMLGCHVHLNPVGTCCVFRTDVNVSKKGVIKKSNVYLNYFCFNK